jgi:hypothetical protein
MAEIYTGGGVPLRMRMDLCSELFSLRKTIVSASDDKKIKVDVMAGRRVKAIRAKLLGTAELTLADEMLVPGFVDLHLTAALTAAKDKPKHEQIAIAAYAKGILATIRVIKGAEARLGFVDANQDAIPEIDNAIDAMLAGRGVEVADPVIDDCIAGGALGDEIRADLVAAVTGGKEPQERLDGFIRIKAAAFDKVTAQRAEMLSALHDLKVKSRASYFATGQEGDQTEINAAYDAYYKFVEEVVTPVENARNEVIRFEQRTIKNAYTRVGEKIIASVIDKSAIGQDAAVKWAAAQEITKPAIARLKKMGYAPDAVRADMAEFYRFTGGRVSLVKIHSKGDKRANATDIEAHGKIGTVNIDGRFCKRTLWHELAHHMESDPVAKMAAGRYIRRRSVDGKQYSLRSLSGNTSYRRDEVAFNGNFFSPYVGKVYGDGVTEVFAMGVESFSDAEMLARRAVQDPQTLEFIAGYVKKPMDPLAKAHMTLRNIVTEMQEDVAEATGNDLEGRIKGLAETVELVPDTDTTWQNGDWRLSRFKQLGQFDQSGYYVLSGKVRNPTTRRVCNGLLLARRNSSGWMETTEIAGTDQSVLRAMFALYRKNGVMPNYYSMTMADYVQRQIV